MKVKLLVFSIFFTTIFFSCKERKSDIKPPAQKALPVPTFKFYLDNSVSMDGYLNEKGSAPFRALISNLLLSCFKDLNPQDPELFYVNTYAHKVTSSISDFHNKFTGFKNTPGRGNSKLDDIFSTIINGLDTNTVSALVTDGIYSMDGTRTGNITINLNTAQASTYEYFKRALKSKPSISVCVVKATSGYDGKYYSEEKGGDQQIINKNRPYYLWLFGDRINLDLVMAKVKSNQFANSGIDSLSIIWFTSNLKTNKNNIKSQISYKNKAGDFKIKRNNTIAKAQKSKNGLLRFSVLVDFSRLPASEEYIKDTSNYNCEGPYNIVKIEKDVSNPNFSYLITISTETIKTGEFSISLSSKLPAWVDSSSTEHDSNINAPTQLNKTFGLRYLLNAVQNAYDSNNGGGNLAEFKIKIAADKSSPFKLIGIVLIIGALLGLILYLKNKRK